MKASEVLDFQFWTAFKVKATQMNLERTVEVMSVVGITDFVTYSTLHYGDVGIMSHLDSMLPNEKAAVALMEMGFAYERIASILLAEYDPLENYFTDRTMETTTDSTLEKEGKEIQHIKGKETSTPSGAIHVTDSGVTVSSTDGSNSVGQGTTYDNASTDPTANDFRNISKTINDQVTSVGSDPDNPRKSTTTYENYKVDREFTNRDNELEYSDRVDSMNGSEEIEEHRSGNSGIFAKQDLIQREIRLRLNNRLIPILVRMVIDAINSGVWEG